MKAIKITPLNLVAAFAVLLFVFSFFPPEHHLALIDVQVSLLFKVLFVALFLVATITDVIFRMIFKQMTKVWLIEIVFIALTILLFLIFRFSFAG